MKDFSVICPCCLTALDIKKDKLPDPVCHPNGEKGWFFLCGKCNYRWWQKQDDPLHPSLSEEEKKNLEKRKKQDEEHLLHLKKIFREFEEDACQVPVLEEKKQKKKDDSLKNPISSFLFSKDSLNSLPKENQNLSEDLIDSVKKNILNEIKEEIDRYTATKLDTLKKFEQKKTWFNLSGKKGFDFFPKKVPHQNPKNFLNEKKETLPSDTPNRTKDTLSHSLSDTTFEGLQVQETPYSYKRVIPGETFPKRITKKKDYSDFAKTTASSFLKEEIPLQNKDSFLKKVSLLFKREKNRDSAESLNSKENSFPLPISLPDKEASLNNLSFLSSSFYEEDSSDGSSLENKLSRKNISDTLPDTFSDTLGTSLVFNTTLKNASKASSEIGNDRSKKIRDLMHSNFIAKIHKRTPYIALQEEDGPIEVVPFSPLEITDQPPSFLRRHSSHLVSFIQEKLSFEKNPSSFPERLSVNSETKKQEGLKNVEKITIKNGEKEKQGKKEKKLADQKQSDSKEFQPKIVSFEEEKEERNSYIASLHQDIHIVEKFEKASEIDQEVETKENFSSNQQITQTKKIKHRRLMFFILWGSIIFITIAGLCLTQKYHTQGLSLWKNSSHPSLLKIPVKLTPSLEKVSYAFVGPKIVIMGEIVNTHDDSLPLAPLVISIQGENHPSFSWKHFLSQTHILPNEHILFRSEKNFPLALRTENLQVEVSFLKN